MQNKTYVIKFGGNVLTKATAISFAKSIKSIKELGANIVIVHGGGPQINSLLDKLGVQSHFVDGMRYTDEATLNAVEMVLSGQVNKMLVKNLNSLQLNGIGLSGVDANLLVAKKLTQQAGKVIDLGQVGEIQTVNAQLLIDLLNLQLIPVIAPIATGLDGQTLNINADVAAGEIARALNADALILMSNIPGLLDSKGQVIHQTNVADIEALIADGTINGGMIPKTRSAIAVLDKVTRVKIIDGRDENSLVQTLTQHNIGTTINQ